MAEAEQPRLAKLQREAQRVRIRAELSRRETDEYIAESRKQINESRLLLQSLNSNR